MANLIQQPTQYNLAYVPNVYTLNDIGTATEFLLRVQIDGINVAEFRQPANPYGVAHFDIQKVLQSYLEPAFVETTSFVSETPKEFLTYNIVYGTVTNGVVDPTLTPSDTKYVINGYDNWRVLNWNDSAYNIEGTFQACEGPGNTTRISEKDFLTNYPLDAYPLRSNSYHTLSFFNRIKNFGDGTAWPGTTEQPAYAKISFYTPFNSLIQTSIYSIDDFHGLGPRPLFNSTSLNTYTDDMVIGTIGVGPQNLKDAGLWPTNGIPPQIWGQITQTFGSNTNIWNLGPSTSIVGYYTVEIYSVDWCYWTANGAPTDDSASTLSHYFGDLLYSYRFNVEDPCTNFNAITVSFINQYGVKDYFTFDRRNTKTVSTNRSNYSKSIGSWSSVTFNIDQHQGSKTTFASDIETDLFLSSNWMSDSESQWLQELYTSPNVQAFVDGQWEPMIITTNAYEEKSYARDKMFQHSIVMRYANSKRVQRG